jgi:hypothetical protein
MIWLYVDTRDVDKVASLASGIFWLVLPSLALFISLPLLLKQGLNFYLSMGLSVLITIACYWLMVTIPRPVMLLPGYGAWSMTKGGDKAENR